MDNSEFLTSALNESGYPLQMLCSKIIKDSTVWGVLAEEYPVGEGENKTAIDIIASQGSEHLFIECKRNSNEYKTWIFLTKRSSILTSNILFLNLYCSSIKINVHPIIKLATATKEKIGMDLNRVDFAIETRFDFSKNMNSGKIKQKKSFATNTIQDACFQLMKGISGFIIEQKLKFKQHPNCFSDRYFPIIITTADLMVAEINEKNLEINQNPLKNEEVNYKPVKAVLYNYPLHNEIFPFYLDQITDLSSLNMIKKIPILIVNINYLSEILKNLILRG